MTRSNYTRWTCDSCGAVEERSVNEPNVPSGWMGVATNVPAPDGSWDQAADWRRHHLCPVCRREFWRGANLEGHKLPNLANRQFTWGTGTPGPPKAGP